MLPSLTLKGAAPRSEALRSQPKTWPLVPSQRHFNTRKELHCANTKNKVTDLQQTRYFCMYVCWPATNQVCTLQLRADNPHHGLFLHSQSLSKRKCTNNCYGKLPILFWHTHTKKEKENPLLFSNLSFSILVGTQNVSLQLPIHYFSGK